MVFGLTTEEVMLLGDSSLILKIIWKAKVSTLAFFLPAISICCDLFLRADFAL